MPQVFHSEKLTAEVDVQRKEDGREEQSAGSIR